MPMPIYYCTHVKMPDLACTHVRLRSSRENEEFSNTQVLIKYVYIYTHTDNKATDSQHVRVYISTSRDNHLSAK